MNYDLPRQAGKTTHLLKTAEKLLNKGESVVYICHTHNEAERLKRLWSEMHHSKGYYCRGYYCRGVISFVTMLDVVGYKQFAEPLKVLIDEPMKCLEGLVTIKPQFEIVDTAGTYDLYDHIVTEDDMLSTMRGLLVDETDSNKSRFIKQ